MPVPDAVKRRVDEIVGLRVVGVHVSYANGEICGLEIEFSDKTRLVICEKYIEGFGWAGVYVSYTEKVA